MGNLQETLEGAAPETTPEGLGFNGEFAPQDKPYWVKGAIRASYSATSRETGQVYEFRTEDVPSKSGLNRNLNIVGEATKQDGTTYNVSGRITYNSANITPDGIKRIQSALAKVNKNIGKLATKEERAAAMQLGKLDQLQQAIQKGTQNPNFRLTLNGNGGINVEPLIDVAVDFEMKKNDRGYSQIERVGAAGTHKGTR